MDLFYYKTFHLNELFLWPCACVGTNSNNVQVGPMFTCNLNVILIYNKETLLACVSIELSLNTKITFNTLNELDLEAHGTFFTFCTS